jgi:hypothetical protein
MVLGPRSRPTADRKEHAKDSQHQARGRAGKEQEDTEGES